MHMSHWVKRGGILVVLASTLAFLGARSPGGGAAPTTLRELYRLAPPRSLSASKTALLLVDFQDEFVHGRLPLPDAERAIEHAVELSAPGAALADPRHPRVQHIAARPDSPLFARGLRKARRSLASSAASPAISRFRSRCPARSRARHSTPSFARAGSIPWSLRG